MIVADVESTPRLNMEAVGKTSILTQVENCLQSDDHEKLEKVIEERGFAGVWKPSDSKGKETALHKASELGCIECVRVLIRHAAKNNISIDVPNSDGETPLFSAVNAVNIDIINELLDAQVHINARNDQGNSILHVIGYDIRKTQEKVKQKSLFSCLAKILDDPNIDVEAHNDSGCTPLFSAAEKMSVNDNSNLVPFCRELLSAGASLDAMKTGVSAKKLLEDRNSLTAVRPNQIKKRSQRTFLSQLLDNLILQADGNEVHDLLSRQPQDEAKAASNSYIGSHHLLFYVVDKSDLKTVEVLLKAGADSTAYQLSGEQCLQRALARGNPELLNLLIDNMKEKMKKRKLDLSYQTFKLIKLLIQNQSKNPNKFNDSDHLKCLKRLLEDDIILNIHERSQRTEGGVEQSVLNLAASFNNQEALRLFIERGAFLGSRKTVSGKDHGNILSALKSETLEKAMDGCITYKPSAEGDTEDILSPDHTLNLDYTFLTPHFDTESKSDPSEINEVKTLMELNQNKTHKQAIKHPLIQTLLYAKWWKVLPFFIANLVLYLAFVISLTLFVYSLKDLRVLKKKASPSNSNTTAAALEAKIENTLSCVKICMGFLIPLTLYTFAREFFQIIYTYKTYLKNFENYLEWILILIVTVLCIANPGLDLTRHLAAWAMIIASYVFVLLLGRVPFLALYVTMLRLVSWNFLKVIFLYTALILAFTVSFNILLEPTETSEASTTAFASFWSTLPRAIVMGTGEFEYSNLSEDFLSSSRIMYAASAVLIFLVFLFVVFFILMNVMNGLAVTDIQQVMDEATLYSLGLRLELIYLIEELLLRIPFAKRCLSHIHLISGTSKSHRLTVKINEPKRRRRIEYGDQTKEFCTLDTDTADVLRSYRLGLLTEEDSVTKCLDILQELRDRPLQGATPPRPRTPSAKR